MFVAVKLSVVLVSDGTVNTMVAMHTEQLLIYQNIQLTWAAQLPTLPVTVRVAKFPYDCSALQINIVLA